MDKVTEYIERAETSIANALDGKSKLTFTQMDIAGMSSARVRDLLNNIVHTGDRYLEIGVWGGSTFVAACYQNNPYAVAIDNFSQFDGKKSEFLNNCFNSGITNFAFLEGDCFNLPPESPQVISNMNVYFYDGDHKEENQRMALTYYIDMLADVFIFIVDDWNHEPARIGTEKAIEELGLIVHKDWHLRTEKNGQDSSWWNGLYVAVCEKPKHD